MNVLSIGAGVEQFSSIKIANSLGLNVISCDANNDVIGKKESFRFYNIDIKNEKEIINLAKKHDIKFIIPSPLGRYLTTVGAVNDALGLKGITKKSALMCTDKYTFNQYLKNHIDLAQQFLVTDANEVLELLKKTISVPFVLKPRFGSGSKGVQVFQSKDEFSIKNYFQNNIYGDILLEKFIFGDEIGIDAIVRNNKVEIIAIRDKVVTPLPYRQELEYSLPSKHQNKKNQLNILLSRAINILEINNSLLHIDAIISSNRIYIIELAPRASGNKITELILPIALTLDPLSLFIKFLMGETIPIESTIKPTIFQFFNFNKEQSNKIIKYIKPFKNIETLVVYNSNLNIGDRVSIITNGLDASNNGYFILQGDQRKMRENIKEIYSNFELREDINESNKKAWSRVINKNTMIYPETSIVSFLARNFNDREENKSKNALDIGFGSGRHLKLLQDYNFNIYGIDYSEESCKVAEDLFALKDNISCEDLRDGPFNGMKFDVIVAYGVMFLKPINEIQTDLETVYNSLKTGGKMIVNFRTKDDFLYQNGKQIDDNTFILSNLLYKDMCYTFFDKDEIEDILINSKFEIINFSRIDYHRNNLREHHSWWIVEVVKL